MMPRAVIAALLLALTACSPFATTNRGGAASVSTEVSKPLKTQGNGLGEASGVSAPSLGMPATSLKQSDSPNSSSSQAVDYEYEESITTYVDTVKETVTNYPDGRSVIVKEPIPAGTLVVKKAKSAVQQELGSSWKDTAKEMAAALGSFQVVQYVGIAVFLFGAVGYFHPVVRPIIGGKDTAMAVGGSGLAMIFGPYLFVKYSNYFFLAILAAGGYWVISRLKYKEAILDAKTGKV